MPFLKGVYLFSIAVALVFSITEGHRHRTSVRRLTFLLGYMLTSEITGFVLEYRGLDKHFLHYVYTPIEVLFLCYLYAAHYASALLGKAVRIAAWSFLGFSVVYGVRLWIDTGWLVSPTTLIVGEWVLIIFLVLYYFYDLYRNDYLLSLNRQPLFWISVGNFFFYSGTFFLMALFPHLEQQNSAQADRLFALNTILNIFMYIFWAIGFLCLRLTI
jgi:hypothetical protein